MTQTSTVSMGNIFTGALTSLMNKRAQILWSVILGLLTLEAVAADFPGAKEGAWVVRDFRFNNGETLPELRLAYTTVGAPTGEPVLVLHGTTGSSLGMLNAGFGGELFGPGQPLDSSKYFVILPDAIGTGKSSKPSFRRQ
jgi:homoserine O-acetyltransferase/O-succinyltransferase